MNSFIVKWVICNNLSIFVFDFFICLYNSFMLPKNCFNWMNGLDAISIKTHKFDTHLRYYLTHVTHNIHFEFKSNFKFGIAWNSTFYLAFYLFFAIEIIYQLNMIGSYMNFKLFFRQETATHEFTYKLNLNVSCVRFFFFLFW